MKRNVSYTFSSILLLAFICFNLNGLIAQSDCMPEDPPYPEFIGVYPTPQNDTLPDGTIFFSDGLPAACAGEPYTFDLTVVVPDSIDAGQFSPLFPFVVALESAILTNPNSTGIPPGFTMETSAVDWTIYGGVTECLRITGMSDTVGEYPIVLSILASSPDILFPVPIDFEGYTLSIVSPNQECLISNIEEPSPTFLQAYNFPNPFQEETTFYLQAKQSTSLTLTVYDIGGRKVHEQALQAQLRENKWNFHKSELSLQSGVYLYTLGNKTDIVGGKMMVD